MDPDFIYLFLLGWQALDYRWPLGEVHRELRRTRERYERLEEIDVGGEG